MNKGGKVPAEIHEYVKLGAYDEDRDFEDSRYGDLCDDDLGVWDGAGECDGPRFSAIST